MSRLDESVVVQLTYRGQTDLLGTLRYPPDSNRCPLDRRSLPSLTQYTVCSGCTFSDFPEPSGPSWTGVVLRPQNPWTFLPLLRHSVFLVLPQGPRRPFRRLPDGTLVSQVYSVPYHTVPRTPVYLVKIGRRDSRRSDGRPTPVPDPVRVDTAESPSRSNHLSTSATTW